MSPTDNQNVLNVVDFTNVGNSISKDYNAFKSIQKYSKLSKNTNVFELSNVNVVFSKLNSLYLSNFEFSNSSNSYAVTRQHNQSSLGSFLPNFSTLLDNFSFDKYFMYSLSYNLNFLKNNKISPEFTFFNKN
jgi:hypothetical protein